MTDWIERLIEINGFGPGWQHICAAISSDESESKYIQRSYMGSSLVSVDDKLGQGQAVDVAVLSEAKLLEIFPPPYDLVKVDIEGAGCVASRPYLFCIVGGVTDAEVAA